MKKDLLATWIFVKSLGYEKRETMHKNHFYIRAKEYSEDSFHSNNVREMCKFALSHYLSAQLGRRWRDAYWAIEYSRNTLGKNYGFEADEWEAIEKAIDYLEQLEKGETA